MRQAIESLRYGGRAGVEELTKIAEMNVVELLGGGLTLEQAETVLKMAVIEAARIAEEARMRPRTPSVEVKFKNKGKK
jgi:hypothetical protein